MLQQMILRNTFLDFKGNTVTRLQLQETNI